MLARWFCRAICCVGLFMLAGIASTPALAQSPTRQGEEIRIVAENQSVYVPLGERHRLENRGKLPVVLIEVQTGAYLGEDDIIRYDDQYARK